MMKDSAVHGNCYIMTAMYPALRLSLLICVLCGTMPLQAAPVTMERVLQEQLTGEHWLLNGGNFRGEHYSPLDQVNSTNVSRLGLDWYTDIPERDGISAIPIVVDGVVYITAARSIVYAFDARTGRVLWRHDPQVSVADGLGSSWISRVNRGVALWQDMVYVATSDCRLLALDRGTGEERWSTLTCDPKLGYSISDAPRVGRDMIFIGNAGSETEKKNRGYVSAWDAATGRFLWRFYTVPTGTLADAKSDVMVMAAKTWSGDVWQQFGGGGSVWNEMTFDPDTNLLYFGTAGAVPYLHAERSPGGGDNLFLSSVLAVHAGTGKYAWHYQTVPGDSWEYNANMNIVLADLHVEGRGRKVLLIAPKNGFFYVLDRLTGEFISAEKYVKVNWASHIDKKTWRPVLLPEGRYWEAEEGEIRLLWPNMWGAHSWQPMAYHPQHKLVYLPAIDIPEVTGHVQGYDIDRVAVPEQVDGKPHVPGKLIAWDPVKQQARWSVARTLPFNGGILTTAGNLVFQGTAAGTFEAFAADTGQQMWAYQTGTAINAAPVSYTVDGKQIVLIAAGAGGAMKGAFPELHATADARGPTRLLAFAHGGTAQLPKTTAVTRKVPEPPESTATAETLAWGKLAYHDYFCAGCHGADAVADVNGSVPDLRYADKATHAEWLDIVLKGSRREDGMMNIEMEADEARAIQAYVIHRAWELYRQ